MRAAGVSEEDRQDVVGHSGGGMHRHYSAPDIKRLIIETEKVVEMRQEPVLRVVSGAKSAQFSHRPPAKIPHSVVSG